jgi:hypothetical protein
MAEITFSPPNAILYVAIGVFVVGVASTFLRKGETRRKVVGLAIVTVVAGALVLFLYRPVTLLVDSEGIRMSGINGVELQWDEVENAYLEANLPASPYRPTVRTRGAAVGDYRSGRFLLSNGDPARVMMERSDQAVIIVTEDLTYLFAPDDIDLLVAAINQYRLIPEEPQ